MTKDKKSAKEKTIMSEESPEYSKLRTKVESVWKRLAGKSDTNAPSWASLDPKVRLNWLARIWEDYSRRYSSLNTLIVGMSTLFVPLVASALVMPFLKELSVLAVFVLTAGAIVLTVFWYAVISKLQFLQNRYLTRMFAIENHLGLLPFTYHYSVYTDECKPEEKPRWIHGRGRIGRWVYGGFTALVIFAGLVRCIYCICLWVAGYC